ncbi:nuclear transport factor 2 family protein [Ottowia sp.]|uniref:nuclear transport factor 2 family protein n=1 Tax=Ottowia sp. TaxID=1898956 RepID=UPI0025F9ED47|nr:nuclear transport factor 2 family protein [Ottowia sp.]
MKSLTEQDAVTAFAKAWNRLEPDRYLALLAPDARYASQWVFEELVGAAAISNYLRGKMRTVRSHGVNNPNSRVRVEVGRTAWGDEGRPCAFMTQGNEVQAAVIFETRDGKVSRYDLCIPQILGAVRTGVFPV